MSDLIFKTGGTEIEKTKQEIIFLLCPQTRRWKN
jgi:hypothetical protein